MTTSLTQGPLSASRVAGQCPVQGRRLTALPRTCSNHASSQVTIQKGHPRNLKNSQGFRPLPETIKFQKMGMWGWDAGSCCLQPTVDHYWSFQCLASAPNPQSVFWSRRLCSLTKSPVEHAIFILCFLKSISPRLVLFSLHNRPFNLQSSLNVSRLNITSLSKSWWHLPKREHDNYNWQVNCLKDLYVHVRTFAGPLTISFRSSYSVVWL